MDRLGEIDVPTTFVAGSRDHRYCEIARSMAAAVPGGRALIVEGAGHNVLLDEPDAVAAAIQR
jgi:pimeloyl-ACP methyl ester carboxylesterase